MPPPSALSSSSNVTTSATHPKPNNPVHYSTHQAVENSSRSNANHTLQQPQQVLPRPSQTTTTTAAKMPTNHTQMQQPQQQQQQQQQQQTHVSRPKSSYGRPNTTSTNSAGVETGNCRRVSLESPSNSDWPNQQLNNNMASQATTPAPINHHGQNIYSMAIHNNHYIGKRPPLNNLPTNAATATAAAVVTPATTVTSAGYQQSQHADSSGMKRPASMMSNPYCQMAANPNKSGRNSL
jgi:hypothetical protein